MAGEERIALAAGDHIVTLGGDMPTISYVNAGLIFFDDQNILVVRENVRGKGFVYSAYSYEDFLDAKLDGKTYLDKKGGTLGTLAGYALGSYLSGGSSAGGVVGGLAGGMATAEFTEYLTSLWIEIKLASSDKPIKGYFISSALDPAGARYMNACQEASECFDRVRKIIATY